MSGLPDSRSSSVSTAGYEDGLGHRSVRFNREVGGMLECLHLRPQIALFEPALRARAAEITALDDERFARVRGFEPDAAGVTVVSELVAGHRLVDILESRQADEAGVSGIDAGLGFLLQAIPALAELHASSITHGAVAPGRILVTPNAQVVLLDNIYGAALERLKLNRQALWTSFGVMTPPTADAVFFDPCTDVAQMAICGLQLSTGRPLDPDAEIVDLSRLVREVRELAEIRGGATFASGVERFFNLTLPTMGRRASVGAEAAATEIQRLVSEIGEDESLNALAELVCYQPLPRVPAAMADGTYDEDREDEEQARWDREEDQDEEEAPVVIAAPPAVIAPPPAPPIAVVAPLIAAEAPAPVVVAPLAAPPAPVLVAPPPAAVASPAPVVVAQPAPPPVTVPPVPVAVAPPAPVYEPPPAPVFQSPPAPAVVAPPQPVFPPPPPQPVFQSPPAPVFQAPPPAPVFHAPPVAAGTPAVVRIRQEGPAGYAPPPRPRDISAPAPAAVRALPFVARGGSGESRSAGPWKIAAAALVVIAVGAFAARGYLVGQSGISAAGQLSQSAPAAVPAPSAPLPATGTLSIDSQPAGATVTLDGREVGVTPLELKDVPAGRHRLSISTGTATVQRTIRVDAGQQAMVNVPVFSGWVAVFSPIRLDVSEGRRSLGSSESGRLMLAPGRHTLTLANKELGFTTTQQVDVEPGEETVLNLKPTGPVNLNASPWAEVWVDGARVGETPLANLAVPLGTREFVFKHPQYGERRLTATVTTAASALSVDFGKPPSRP